jgi:hypothetical protein
VPAPPTDHATSREEAHQLAFSALAAVVVIVIPVALIFLLPALAQETSQQVTAEAAAAQHVTGDQETQDPTVTITVIVLVVLVPFAHEARDPKATNAASANGAFAPSRLRIAPPEVRRPELRAISDPAPPCLQGGVAPRVATGRSARVQKA